MTDYLQSIALRGAGRAPSDGPAPLMPRIPARFEPEREAAPSGWMLEVEEDVRPEVGRRPAAPIESPPGRPNPPTDPRQETLISDSANAAPRVGPVQLADETVPAHDRVETGPAVVDRRDAAVTLDARVQSAPPPPESAPPEEQTDTAQALAASRMIAFTRLAEGEVQHAPTLRVRLARPKDSATPFMPDVPAGDDPARESVAEERADDDGSVPLAGLSHASDAERTSVDIRVDHPPMTVNIGRIEVEIAQAPQPTPARRQVERTRGFAMYERARRGYLR